MVFFVVYQDQNHQDPTPAYCAQIRDSLGLTMPVLMDKDHVMHDLLNVEEHLNDWHFLLGWGVMGFRLKWVTLGEILPKLDLILAAETTP
jgi:hypothetical protein